MTKVPGHLRKVIEIELKNFPLYRVPPIADKHRKICTTIESIMSDLPEEYKKLIELKYFKKYNNQLIADKLNISRRSIYCWRDRVIYHFAVAMNYI